MGLRFRKSVTLCKGVKLNFGKTGVSVTTGVRGFHNTYNLSTGKTTTSVGIPGTGLSYVTTSGGKRVNRQPLPERGQNHSAAYVPRFRNEEIELAPPTHSVVNHDVPDDAFLVKPSDIKPKQIQAEKIKTLHYLSDRTVDWTEILISDKPDSDCDDVEFWHYCHDRAYKVLNGDIETYLEIIKDTNPLDDLLDYGIGFECGTDNSHTMYVEFESKQNEIMPEKSTMNSSDYFELLQDYICSCALRVGRDIFALLPVSNVIYTQFAKLLLSIPIWDRLAYMTLRVAIC